MSGVLDIYIEHRKQDLGPRSIVTLGHRLKAITRVVERDRLLSAVTPAIAAELYAARSIEVSPDTHRGELAAAAAMFAWCLERGWLRTNPFAGVKPTGRKSVRKDHLRIDEARMFRDAALGDATDAGLASAMALLMGLRASEVTDRLVRDVDDAARVLWISGAKTDAGDRCLEVPSSLRTRLKKLVTKRDADEKLFGDVDRRWLGYHVRRICTLAEVPVVSPHALRRSWAAIGGGAMSMEEVSQKMGHASTSITRRHYQPTNAEEQRKGAVMLRSIAGGRR